MKTSVIAGLIALTSILTIGCTTVEKTATGTPATTKSPRIASSETVNPALAPVASGPSTAWGNSSHLY